MKNQSTRAVILYHRKNKDLFAYFPSEGVAYSHIGQHSACSVEYVKECRAVTSSFPPNILEEKDTLLKELQSIGYDLLRHVKNCHREPNILEIKLGYGATHYIDIEIEEVWNNKKADIKKKVKYLGAWYSTK